MTEFKLEDEDAAHIGGLVFGLARTDDVLERIVSNNNAGLRGDVPRKALITTGRVIVAQIIGAGGGN
jgi:hypothetical protein